MSNEVLGEEGKKTVLLGNEAIVRGALEAGVAVATTYPGTPASEIGDTFAEIAKDAGIYFEYSTNEKVAFETAAGAALSGVRSIVSFKQFGLNVASDSVPPMAYLGVKGGMVIVVADDPNCWSSGQSEQDSRYFARIAHMPMLEPSDAQEAKDLTKFAFNLSERFGLPVFLRTTTRVSHMKSVVKLGKIIEGKRIGKFEKGIKYRNFPPQMMETHRQLHEKLEEISKASEKNTINFFVNECKSDLGIIVTGVSFNYLMEAMEELNLRIPLLKIGMSYPLPEGMIGDFIKNLKVVLVAEELEPIVESEVKRIAKEVNPKIVVRGKDMLPVFGEYKPEMIIQVLAKLTGKNVPKDLAESKFDPAKVEKRLAQLCAGCPHRASFWAVKKALGPDKVFAGDIGCYILGIHPPINEQDFCISMGASIGVSHGISKSTKDKPVVFIGDSTFFHASIPGLINAVYNKGNMLVIVLDNRTTAMTGHQPHPGTGATGMGEESKILVIEDVAKACGIENIKVVNAFNVNEFTKAVKEFYELPGVSLIVARGECRLQTVRKMTRKGIKIPKFEFVDQKNAKKIEELRVLGCPALRKEGGRFYIDQNICWGCGVCAQIYPEGIKARVGK
jgi:indolepyruvate ferredoxin oxidoreductase alpha subunit